MLACVLRSCQNRETPDLRYDLFQQLDALSAEIERHQADTGEIAAGAGKALDETRVDGITTEGENNGARRLDAVHGIHIATEHDNNFWIGRQHLARKTLGLFGRPIGEEHA
jgi:hypothetical protein